MPTNKQRREASRRHLERQLQRRQEQEATRKKFTLIASIAGSIILIAVIVVAVVLLSSGSDDKKNPKAAGSPTPSATAKATTTTTPAAPTSTAPPPPAAKGPSVSFDGVTVGGAKDLSGMPPIKSKMTKAPTKLEYKDLVVGKGKPATAKSTVTIQYVGALYKNGKVFDSSWKRGQTAQFPLSNVIPGFKQGISGTKDVPPMKVGGRRLIIMPAALGYGANPQQGSGIPPNAPLVFVVDLKKIG